MELIKCLAEKNGLKIIETTSSQIGCPENLHYALIGFNDFEQATELAEKEGLTIRAYIKKNGWRLWSRRNKTKKTLLDVATSMGVMDFTRDTWEYAIGVEF